MTQIYGMDKLEELRKGLSELSERIQYNVLRTSIFRGAQKVRDLAKQKLVSNGSSKTGRLLRDIRAIRIKSTKEEVIADVQGGTRRGKKSGWYGRLVEKGHLIKHAIGFEARGKNSRSFEKTTQGPATQIRKKKEEVGHVPARPFLVPALEENKGLILKAIADGIQIEIKKVLEKAMSGNKRA
jgi:hypothetical protein